MRSSFFEFQVAISGTFTARNNLEIVSHNTANAAIKGYSRQTAAQKANEPLALNTGKGMVGTGSQVYAVTQERDIFLDSKYWAQRAVMGEYSGKKSMLTVMENIFNEMNGNTGLSSSINDFFSKASELAANANDPTYRTNLIQSADTLTKMINIDAEALRKQQNDANTEVSIIVEQINSLGEQIISLNKQIATHELDGSHANDLRDERARLVDDLSQLVNTDAREIDLSTERKPNNKRYIVMINGYDFVNHYNINTLKTVPRDTAKPGDLTDPPDRRNPMDAGGLYDVIFATNNVVFDIYHPRLKGQLKGLVDIRDGNGASEAAGTQPTTDYKGIPYYLEKLNTLVRRLALAVDQGKYVDGTNIGITGHANGYDLYGNNPGTLMFTYAGGQTEGPLLPDMPGFYNRMNCFNFMVNRTLMSDPKRLNCASDNRQGESDYTVTMGLADIYNNPSLFREGKLTDFVTALNAEMGIDSKQAGDFEASYGDMTAAADNQRINVSGVDINEEMVNMVKNQQLFQASAKLAGVINNIYETLINRLGA